MVKRSELNSKQKAFLEAYHSSKNAVQSYLYVYPQSAYYSARTSAANILSKSNAKEYLEALENKSQAISAIVINSNLQMLLKMLKRFEVISIKSAIIVDKRWPDVDDDEAIQKLSTREIKDLAAAGKTIQDMVLSISELRNQLSGTSAIQDEILNKIKNGEWYPLLSDVSADDVANYSDVESIESDSE